MAAHDRKGQSCGGVCPVRQGRGVEVVSTERGDVACEVFAFRRIVRVGLGLVALRSLRVGLWRVTSGVDGVHCLEVPGAWMVGVRRWWGWCSIARFHSPPREGMSAGHWQQPCESMCPEKFGSDVLVVARRAYRG